MERVRGLGAASGELNPPPQGTSILKKSGFSTREYLIALRAFLQSATVDSFRKAVQASAADQWNLVHAAYIERIEKNWA